MMRRSIVSAALPRHGHLVIRARALSGARPCINCSQPCAAMHSHPCLFLHLPAPAISDSQPRHGPAPDVRPQRARAPDDAPGHLWQSLTTQAGRLLHRPAHACSAAAHRSPPRRTAHSTGWPNSSGFISPATVATHGHQTSILFPVHCAHRARRRPTNLTGAH